MFTYVEWCKHYGYDPETAEAKADYSRYLEQLAVFRQILKAPNDEN